MAKSVTTKESIDASPKAVGRRLRKIRIDQGLARGAAARSAGLTRRELARYERGRRHLRIGELRSIAGSCGVELDALLPPESLDSPLSFVETAARVEPWVPEDLTVQSLDSPDDPLDVLESLAPPPPAPPLQAETEVPETAWVTGTIVAANATIDHPHAGERGNARWAITGTASQGPDQSDQLAIEANIDFSGGPGFGVLVGARIDEAGRLSAYSFDVDPLSGGGGYVLRAWEQDRPHWWPLAGAAVADLADLFGPHTIAVALDHECLEAYVDGRSVLSVPTIKSRARSLGAGPCPGTGLGIIAWADSDLVVTGVRVAGR